MNLLLSRKQGVTDGQTNTQSKNILFPKVVKTIIIQPEGKTH